MAPRLLLIYPVTHKLGWVRQVRPSQIPYIVRVLCRTQRMMKPAAYLREHQENRIVPPGYVRALQPSEICLAAQKG